LEGASDPEVIKSLLSELSNKWYIYKKQKERFNARRII
jgi:hypothetical protein